MMLSLQITFERPLFLLLILVFLAATLIPYFTLSKKYRKTRNRITSMVLHGLTCLLVVFLMSGMTFISSKANSNNELLLVVDVSETSIQALEKRDDFVKTVINDAKYENLKVGVVTFGFDQEYAVELTRDYGSIYGDYKNATLPDISATNVASALTYAATLFDENCAKKIVLVTDGKETDDNARSIIRSVTASGITIDCAYLDTSYEGEDDYQIMSVTYPDYHVGKGEECTILVDVYSRFETTISMTLTDNDETIIGETVDANLVVGTQTLAFKHTFSTEGLHELSFGIDSNDLVTGNNVYASYYYLEVFNNVLILEQRTGDSDKLSETLAKDNTYKVTVLNVLLEDLPKTVEDLCQYDEVILNNIANSDLPSEFVEILQEYVMVYGGGLFTTGGSVNDEAHAYNRNDLVGTKLQQMLPVQAINYTPPVGVIVIIDRSGSMGGTDEYGNTLLSLATSGAISCLNSLTERDYIGIMTLDSDYNTILELTPRTEEAKIISAIQSIDSATGSTVYPGAILQAGQQLRALKNVDKKHIIIVSDGQVPASEVEIYEQYAKNFYETDGITISVIGVKMSEPYNAEQLEDENYSYENLGTSTPFEKMLRLTKITHGNLHVIDMDHQSTIISEMREDLNAPEIKEVNYEEFYPQIVNATSSIFNGVTRLNDEEHSDTLSFTLDGFYGVKVRDSADLLLTGNYNVPIYAQWKYGKGTVGSFMCDLYGEWSADLFTEADGVTLLYNIINNLTPTENIRSNDIKLVLYEDNYSNTLSIYTTLKEGEYLKGTLKYQTQANEYTVSLNEVSNVTKQEELRALDAYVETALNADNNYSRTKFIAKKAGTYTILIEKYDAENKLIGSNTIYKCLSYSDEYDTLFGENTDFEASLERIATLGNGVVIADLEDPHEVIDTFDTVVYKTFDPRYLFAVIAIIMFLADIAVRKFKFKWPHELIKEKIGRSKK